MKKQIFITMLLLALAAATNAQTGTCAAPVVLSTGFYGDFYAEFAAVPGDFFVVEVSHDNGSTWVSARCQSTMITAGKMKLYAASGTVFGPVASGDLMRVAKYCHSISGYCNQGDNDYGAFTTNITVSTSVARGKKK